MGDPGLGVNHPAFNEFDDPWEIAGMSVSGGKQRHFPTMKKGIGKTDRIGNDSHKYHPAGKPDKIKAPCHRLGVAGVIMHQRGQSTPTGGADRFQIGIASGDGNEVLDIELFADKIQSNGVGIRH